MRTKLIIQIEIDETLDETTKLFIDLYNKKEFKIKDLFNPDHEIHIKELSSISAEQGRTTLQQAMSGNHRLKDPNPSIAKFIMMKRK